MQGSTPSLVPSSLQLSLLNQLIPTTDVWLHHTFDFISNNSSQFTFTSPRPEHSVDCSDFYITLCR